MKNTNNTQVEFHFVTITPSDAKARLSTLDPRQRSLKTSLVDYLARQIAQGEWNENTAEPIKLSPIGAVLDGQHRLAAIVRANTPVRCHVALNVPEDTMGTLDTGISRSPADQCKYLGHSNATSVASCVRQILILKSRMEGTASHRGRITAGELQAAVNTYGDHIQAAIKLVPKTTVLAVPRPVFRAVYVHACMSGFADQAESFFSQYVSGANLSPGSPVLALRQWMERRLSEGSQTGAGRNVLVAAVLIRTFNAFLADKQVKKISYKVNSAFPTFKPSRPARTSKTVPSPSPKTQLSLKDLA